MRIGGIVLRLLLVVFAALREIIFARERQKTAQFHFLLADITAAGWQNAKSVLSAFTSYDYVTLIFRGKPMMNNTSFDEKPSTSATI